MLSSYWGLLSQWPGTFRGVQYETSHSGLRSSTVWRGHFPFLLLKTFTFTDWEDPSGNSGAHFCQAMFTILQTSGLQSAACNDGLIPDKNPWTNHPSTVLFLELSQSLDQPWYYWEINPHSPLSYFQETVICSEHLPVEESAKVVRPGLGLGTE